MKKSILFFIASVTMCFVFNPKYLDKGEANRSRLISCIGTSDGCRFFDEGGNEVVYNFNIGKFLNK